MCADTRSGAGRTWGSASDTPGPIGPPHTPRYRAELSFAYGSEGGYPPAGGRARRRDGRFTGDRMKGPCPKLWRRAQDGLCPTPISRFVNLRETEAEREQLVLLAHRPRPRKAEP